MKVITKREGSTGDAWSALFADKHETVVRILVKYIFEKCIEDFSQDVINCIDLPLEANLSGRLVYKIIDDIFFLNIKLIFL